VLSVVRAHTSLVLRKSLDDALRDLLPWDIEFVIDEPVDEQEEEPEVQVRIVNDVYYESIKREPKIRGIYECRCDERLQTKTKKFTRLPYTGLVLELEHLKIETRSINERFANAMGECEN
jgi:hypothetical protein